VRSKEGPLLAPGGLLLAHGPVLICHRDINQAESPGNRPEVHCVSLGLREGGNVRVSACQLKPGVDVGKGLEGFLEIGVASKRLPLAWAM
jgi:hypothetical protein